MVSTAIQILLTLIEGLLPSLGVSGSSVVEKILAALIQVVPLIAQEATDLITPVKNIIAALSNSGAVTADQITTLQALDAQCDGNFESAAQAAGAQADPNAATS